MIKKVMTAGVFVIIFSASAMVTSAFTGLINWTWNSSVHEWQIGYLENDDMGMSTEIAPGQNTRVGDDQTHRVWFYNNTNTNQKYRSVVGYDDSYLGNPSYNNLYDGSISDATLKVFAYHNRYAVTTKVVSPGEWVGFAGDYEMKRDAYSWNDLNYNDSFGYHHSRYGLASGFNETSVIGEVVGANGTVVD